MSIFRKTNVIFLAIPFILMACGGGGGDDDNTSPRSNPDAPTAIIGGLWDVTDRVDARDCDEGQYTEEYQLRFDQEGTSFTVYSDGQAFNGSIRGNTINWQGNTYEDGGTVSNDVEIIITGTSATGTTHWTWSDGVESCSGTTRSTGTCVSGSCLPSSEGG